MIGPSDQHGVGSVVALAAGDPGPVQVVVDWSGVVLHASHAFTTLVGSTPDPHGRGPALGTSLYDILAPGDRAALHQLLVQAAAPDADACAAMLVGRREDGLPLAVTATIARGVARDDGTTVVLTRWGGPVAWSGGEPLAPPPRTGADHVLSHDVRATIRNARNFVNLFARKLSAADPAPDLPGSHLETALRALATGDETLDRIVWFMRLEDDPIAVQALPLTTLVELARRQASGDLTELATADGQAELAAPIEVELRTTEPAAPTDPTRPLDAVDAVAVVGNLELLTWTLAEVFVNARKFGGADAAIAIDATPANGFLDLRLTNTGRPIDPELADDAFKLGRMLQARGERPGVGLGLPLARRIVTRHGGRIAFVPADRTTLAISLLLAPARPAEAAGAVLTET